MIKSATNLSAFYVPLPSETVEFVRCYIVTHKSAHKKAYIVVCCLPKSLLLLATRLVLTGVEAEGWRDWTYYRV